MIVHLVLDNICDEKKEMKIDFANLLTRITYIGYE